MIVVHSCIELYDDSTHWTQRIPRSHSKIREFKPKALRNKVDSSLDLVQVKPSTLGIVMPRSREYSTAALLPLSLTSNRPK